MPNNTDTRSEVQRIADEQKDRREALELALEDVPQACIDLMCVVVEGDAEKRSASYWLGEAFVYVHKYQKRLREYAAERKANAARKENESFFDKYIAMNPVKNAAELLTLMQRFGVCPQVPIPVAEAQATTSATTEAQAETKTA
jgi:hypothetical protein